MLSGNNNNRDDISIHIKFMHVVKTKYVEQWVLFK